MTAGKPKRGRPAVVEDFPAHSFECSDEMWAGLVEIAGGERRVSLLLRMLIEQHLHEMKPLPKTRKAKTTAKK